MRRDSRGFIAKLRCSDSLFAFKRAVKDSVFAVAWVRWKSVTFTLEFWVMGWTVSMSCGLKLYRSIIDSVEAICEVYMTSPRGLEWSLAM